MVFMEIYLGPINLPKSVPTAILFCPTPGAPQCMKLMLRSAHEQLEETEG